MSFLFTNYKHFYNSYLFKITIYLIAAFFYTYFAGLSLPDDGLRHIAFAAHPDIMKSWGDVFPHSLFFKEYDPWFVWHKIIAFYLLFIPYESVHLAINFTVIFTLMLLLDKLFLKYSTLKNSPIVLFIILTVVLLGSFRYINVRPDLLSGIFLITALLLNRYTLLLFIFTILYSTSYYLFFLYTGSLGLMYLVLKEYKPLVALFLGSLIGLGLHLYFAGKYYIDTIVYLLTDQSLREGLQVGEGLALFSILGHINYFILVLFSLVLSFIIIFKYYSYFKKQPIALLLLLMSPLWLAQERYFTILKPIFFIYFFIEFKHIFSLLLKRQILYYLYNFLHIIKNFQYKSIFLIPALLYTTIMFGYMMREYDLKSTLQSKYFYKNPIFNNQTILLNNFTIDIYYALYLNPTLKFIPSCSIGWFKGNKEMKELYIKMMKNEGLNEQELSQLLKFVNVKYYFHFLSASKQILSFIELQKLHIEAKLILDNKIIFERKETNDY